MQPLVFSDVHSQDFGIRVNDGQWCFQFVAGVCDKLLLFFVALGKGLDDPAGQKDQQKQDRQQSAGWKRTRW